MPQKSSSSTDKTRLAGGRADVVSTPSGCARTPCDLQPDCFQTNQVDKRIASKDGAERQLNLRIDRIKQCLLECKSDSGSAPEARRPAASPTRQQGSQHHFCVNYRAAESTAKEDHSSESEESVVSSTSGATYKNLAREQRKAGHSHAVRSHSAEKQRALTAVSREFQDQPYNQYKMSAINKLTTELARKQRECRKAKLHAVALQEELAWARLTGKARPAGFPPNTSCSRAAMALDALAASTQQGFGASWPARRKKHAAAVAPNVAAHMAAASAAVAAGKKADQLTCTEHNSLLRQLHRDNAWLLGCLRDSNAALEQLHDRLEAEQKGSPAYKALQQSLCEEAHRRLQAVEQLQDVRQQLDSSDKQARCWEHAAESGAAKIAQLQDDLANETRQRRGAEGKLEVAKQVSHENERLQEKLNSYRKEMRQLEASCHARSEAVQVLQAQLRELEGILSDRHEDITNLHDQLASTRNRVAELELLRGRECGEHDKLERLEVCAETLVKSLQLEHDKKAAEKSQLLKENSSQRSRLVAEKQHAAVLEAQLRVVKEESKEAEERLLRQVREVQADRNSCLEAACQADKLLSRFGDDKLLGAQYGKASSPREKVRALEDLDARLTACTRDRSFVDRATTALEGITSAGTTLLKMKGQEARRGTGATQTSPSSITSGKFAQLFQDIHALEHPKLL